MPVKVLPHEAGQACVLKSDLAGGSSRIAGTARTGGNHRLRCERSARMGAAAVDAVELRGTDEGRTNGLLEGATAVGSSLGAARRRVNRVAQFHDPTRAGHLRYRLVLLGPDGQDLLERLSVPAAARAGD